MVTFRRHVEVWRSGDYAPRIALRKKDAFQDIAAGLNDLAELLESKSGSASP